MEANYIVHISNLVRIHTEDAKVMPWQGCLIKVGVCIPTSPVLISPVRAATPFS